MHVSAESEKFNTRDRLRIRYAMPFLTSIGILAINFAMSKIGNWPGVAYEPSLLHSQTIQFLCLSLLRRVNFRTRASSYFYYFKYSPQFPRTFVLQKHPSSLVSTDARAWKRASFTKLARSGNKEKLKLPFSSGIPRHCSCRHSAPLHTNYAAHEFAQFYRYVSIDLMYRWLRNQSPWKHTCCLESNDRLVVDLELLIFGISRDRQFVTRYHTANRFKVITNIVCNAISQL